jgi:hypothetical protein
MDNALSSSGYTGRLVFMFQGRKNFFFEKKKQKTFIHWTRRSDRRRAKVQKFFASFFQKRRFLKAYPW